MQSREPQWVETAPDLREYLAVLRRRKWSIGFLALTTVAAALAFSFRQTPVYESTAKVQVKPPTVNQYLVPVAPGSLLSMDTERQLAESSGVASTAAERLDVGLSANDLLGHVEVSVATNTQILEITFSSEDPGIAARGAQAFATSYLDFKVSQATEAFTRIEGALLDRISELQRDLLQQQQALARAEPGTPAALEAQSRIDILTSRIASYENQLSDLSLIELDPGEIIQPAEVPGAPASPHVRNGLLALAVGLALGIGFAFLRERLDDRLTERSEFEEALGAPVLAAVPRVPGWRKRDRTELAALRTPKGAVAEAYRALRTHVLFMAKEGELKVIAVTSPSLGEGKTTTAANLAVSISQTGKHVIVVGCDLHKPRLHRFFSLSSDPGLTTALEGRAILNDVVQRPAGLPNLRLISAGPVPANPSELLSSPRMTAFLEQLRKAADFVILDTPPALTVADALVLAPAADGVLVVADASRTTRLAIRHLREQLDQVGGNVIGGVFNNFDLRRARYYTSYQRYGYGYGYGERSRAEKGRAGGSAGGSGRGQGEPDEIWRTEDMWS